MKVVLRNSGKFLIVIFFISIVVLIGSGIRNMTLALENILYSDRNIKLLELSEKLYYKDAGEVSSGDKCSWTVIKADSEDEIESLFTWKSDRNQEIEKTLDEGKDLIDVAREYRADISEEYRYYVREFVRNDGTEDSELKRRMIFLKTIGTDEIYVFEDVF